MKTPIEACKLSPGKLYTWDISRKQDYIWKFYGDRTDTWHWSTDMHTCEQFPWPWPNSIMMFVGVVYNEPLSEFNLSMPSNVYSYVFLREEEMYILHAWDWDAEQHEGFEGVWEEQTGCSKDTLM